MSKTVRVTAVNHVAQEIGCSPEALYREILSAYVETDRHVAAGLKVESLSESDPSAFRGGYRLTLKNEAGQLVDDRTCLITERDDSARRVSLRADYHMPAQMGLTVHATYQAAPAPAGAKFQIDCHTDLDLELPADRSRENIAKIVADFERQSGEYLTSYLIELKAMLEAAP